MSATNRSERGGDGVDFFATPAWAVHRLLDAWPEVDVMPASESLWFEPGAGDGAIVRAVQSWEIANFKAATTRRWVVAEIEESRRESLASLPNLACPPIIGDLLQDTGTERRFDVALANPPYRRASDFLRVALRRSRVVAFLLRFQFLESAERHPFLSRCPPDVYVLPQRPSFDGGGTDSTSYMWAVWNADHLERPQGTVQILGLTSEAERAVGRPEKTKARSHLWKPSEVVTKQGASLAEVVDVCTVCDVYRMLSRTGPRWKYLVQGASTWSPVRPGCLKKIS